ncbi:hypothetical protein CNMCM5623_004430 [Aspergillus felis]|uniref:Uncharacterized protein n=1 Tax=Aspergillus felis TaxID=1287682 RepID=A0A8H6R210_9EURO|nr:hypothetical protein CNMCM5623_004430 [Aspergillus felis]KAF7184441.1 hypothetical protein CNMCM7691_005261 [Aspergillus felis]
MPVSVLLPKLFLPKSVVKLGRFVTNVDEPHRDYYDPSLPLDSSCYEKVELNYDSVDTLVGHRRFYSELSSFLSSSISKSTKISLRITTEQAKTYYLGNNGQWFRDVAQLDDARKWIERTIDEGEDIYLVVGFHTILDAHIVEQSGEQSNSGGKLVVPITTALAASGVFIQPAIPVDPGLSGMRGRAEDQQRHFVAQGEQIVAVQYRKVRFKFFSSKDIDKATLAKKTRWERYDRPRYLQSNDEDMMEIELEDDFELGGNRERCMAGPEVLFGTQNTIG